MPELSRFLGIVILMFFKDHNPAHFHARYSGKEGKLDIKNNKVIEGNLPPRVASLILEWSKLNKNELLKN